MNEKDNGKTLYDRIVNQAKNNPIIVAIMIIFVIYIAFSQLIKATKENTSFFFHQEDGSTLIEFQLQILNGISNEERNNPIDSIKIIAIGIGEAITDTNGIVVFEVDPKRNRSIKIDWIDLKERFWDGTRTFFIHEGTNKQTIRLIY